MISGPRRKAALFLEYCRTFGVGRTVGYVVSRALSRARVRTANALLPARVACPCCNWTGHSFDDYIEVGYRLDHYVCPSCGSQPRHRYFHVWLRQTFRLAEKSGVSIVFAFERPLAKLWDDAKRLRTIRTDIGTARTVDVIANAERLPFRNDCADLVWCHHVLEHVTNDRAAIGELCRVLRTSTGALIVSVPMSDAAATLEYGFADPAESGHRRRYGADFVQRLSEAGLCCVAARMALPEPDMRRFGVRPEPFFVCTKEAGRP